MQGKVGSVTFHRGEYSQSYVVGEKELNLGFLQSIEVVLEESMVILVYELGWKAINSPDFSVMGLGKK